MSEKMKTFLKNKVQDNLYEFFAKDMSSARDGELYSALARTIRLLIGKYWSETILQNQKDKRLYILSFEYTLGNRLKTNAIKTDVLDDLVELLNENDRDFEKISNHEIESALGFGDLGLITTTMLESLTNLGTNAYAYGLRYRKGMLKQEIIDGQQVERPDDWKNYKYPWEHEKSFSHLVEFKDYKVKSIPYDVPILGYKNETVNTLRLWKSESVDDIDFKLFSEGRIHDSYTNINKANAIVEFLYPQEDSYNGRKLRLMQEYFFASATIQDILKKYKKYHGLPIQEFFDHAIIQINDIHPVISILVFIDLVIKKYGVSFEEAVSIGKKSFTFLTSSLLPENFESWDLSLINEVCPNLMPIIKKLSDMQREELKDLQCENKRDLFIVRDQKLRTMNLGYYMADKVFTFSDSHQLIMEKIYLPKHYKYYEDKIQILKIGFNGLEYIIENNPDLYDFIESKDKNQIALYDQENLEAIYEIKLKNKKRLVEFLDSKDVIINPKSIFSMNVGIFHEYKRQLLSALSIALLYYELKMDNNLDIPERTYFFGGKSYPNYYFAKEIIKFINALKKLINKDFMIKDKIKIVFVENYNVKKSSFLLPAADLKEHLTVPTMESTDPGIIRSMVNGAINISSDNDILREMKASNLEDSIYEFGTSTEDSIDIKLRHLYDARTHMLKNPIIRDMYNFYKSQNYMDFPYNISIIFDNLLKYNDSFFVLRDLLDYHRVHKKACMDYLDKEEWLKKTVNNINFAMNHSMNQAIANNLNSYWR